MIRRATEADLPEMRRVFDAARAISPRSTSSVGYPGSHWFGLPCAAIYARAADCMFWRMIRGFTARSRS